MLDPIVHQETRLRVLTVLHKNREVGFAGLCAALHVSQGNLGAHLEKLQGAGYVAKHDRLTPRGFQPRYHLTDTGTKAFLGYVGALRGLLE